MADEERRSRRHTIAGQLQPDAGVEYGYEARAAQYPVGPELSLTPDVVAGVARVLHDSGWPAVRHRQDVYRLVSALRWYASGSRANAPARGVESL